MRVKLLIILVLLTSCGKIKVQHEVKGNVQGDINHVVQFSLDEIKDVFYQQCKADNPTYTEEELQDCKNEKIEEFLNYFNEGNQNAPDNI